MQRFLNTTHRNVAWFKKAADSSELDVKAPFQRNPVWSDRQKSALIESILLEYPIPELYMQEFVDEAGRERHVVVDGQQRIRAVLSFLAGEYELENDSLLGAGLVFDELTPAQRKKVFEYSFVVRVLPDMPDEEIRGIFQRINRNTVTLNNQELRHATYWGPFIKLMEEIADLEIWDAFAIFSANDRRRMLDVEFISELAIAYLNGPQNKKRTLEEFYQLYETEFDEAAAVRATFLTVLGELSQILPNMPRTRWRKKSDFYSLFSVFARSAHDLPLSTDRRHAAATTLLSLANDVDALIADIPIDDSAIQSAQTYLKAVERAASDLANRKARDQILTDLLTPIFDRPALPPLPPLPLPEL
jgi:hypothetical protein